MSKLPVLSGKKLLSALKKNGFYELRRKGSHVIAASKNSDCSTVIPVHANEDLGKGILKSILNDLDLSVSDLRGMLKR